MQRFSLTLKLRFVGTPDKPERKLKGGRGCGWIWENRRAGIVSVVLRLFFCWLSSLCCLRFEPVPIKERRVQGKNKRVLIWICFDWSLFTSDALKDLQKYIFLCFSISSPAELLHPYLISSPFLPRSSRTAPALRLCPTASASPPSSARTRRPPFTTPPGCSSSRSGSGPASPPSSRRPKSSPQSVPFNLPNLTFSFNTFVFYHPHFLFITLSLRDLYLAPSFLIKCGLPPPASVCLFMRAVVFPGYAMLLLAISPDDWWRIFLK